MTADGSVAREDQLREELSEHRRFLRSLDTTGDFVSEIIRNQTEGRIRFLSEELDAVTSKLLDLRFDDRLHSKSIQTSLLSNLLSRFQTALTYTGWALEAGPGIRGTPPSRIDRSTDTEVLALSTGSFLVRIRKSSLELDSELLDTAVHTVMELASAASQDSFTNDIEEKAQLLGREPSRRLALFFKKLSESSLTTHFYWKASPDWEVEIDPSQAGTLSMWLEEMEDRVREVSVRGVLKVADTFRNRFAIEDESGHRYEGRAEAELLAHAEIEAIYDAEMQITTSTSDRTGAVTEKITLLRLSRSIGVPAEDGRRRRPPAGPALSS